MTAETAEPIRREHTGAFHGFAEHPKFCGGCRTEMVQAAEQSVAEQDARISGGVAALAAAVQTAGACVSTAQGALAFLIGAYDVELVEVKLTADERAERISDYMPEA